MPSALCLVRAVLSQAASGSHAPWLTTCPRLSPSPPSLPPCRARGISAEMARQMLVYSFGREVVQALRDNALQGRVEAAVTATLAGFVSAAVAP